MDAGSIQAQEKHRMDWKVLVIATGGTLVMNENDQGELEPVPGFLKQYMDANIRPFVGKELPDYDVHEWEPIIDSSNMSMDLWYQMASDVQQSYEAYDGFVITHGTDTMAYTASALSFLFKNLGKPVVLTGGQIPLVKSFQDSSNNLVGALKAAAGEIAEVLISFDNKILRGNRSSKTDPWFQNAFQSPNFPVLVEMGVQDVYTSEEYKKRAGRPLPLELTVPDKDHLYKRIFVFWLVPGFAQEEMANALGGLHDTGLIFGFYGVGNGPQDTLLPVLRALKEQGNEMVMITQTGRGSVDPTIYAAGGGFGDVIMNGRDMTVEAAYTKLAVLMGIGIRGEDLKTRMQANLRGELSCTNVRMGGVDWAKISQVSRVVTKIQEEAYRNAVKKIKRRAVITRKLKDEKKLKRNKKKLKFVLHHKARKANKKSQTIQPVKKVIKNRLKRMIGRKK